MAGTAGYRAVGSAHVHPTAATRVRVSAMSSSEIQLQTGLLLFWRSVVSHKAKHCKNVRFIHQTQMTSLTVVDRISDAIAIKKIVKAWFMLYLHVHNFVFIGCTSGF